MEGNKKYHIIIQILTFIMVHHNYKITQRSCLCDVLIKHDKTLLRFQYKSSHCIKILRSWNDIRKDKCKLANDAIRYPTHRSFMFNVPETHASTNKIYNSPSLIRSTTPLKTFSTCVCYFRLESLVYCYLLIADYLYD